MFHLNLFKTTYASFRRGWFNGELDFLRALWSIFVEEKHKIEVNNLLSIHFAVGFGWLPMNGIESNQNRMEPIVLLKLANWNCTWKVNERQTNKVLETSRVQGFWSEQIWRMKSFASRDCHQFCYGCFVFKKMIKTGKLCALFPRFKHSSGVSLRWWI